MSDNEPKDTVDLQVTLSFRVTGVPPEHPAAEAFARMALRAWDAMFDTQPVKVEAMEKGRYRESDNPGT